MLDLYNNKYDRTTLKENIYAVKLIDILKTQTIDVKFAVRYILHLFTFQTPILTAKKIKKCKINSRNFTYDGLTFSSSGFILEEVKDEI
jgi:hypothetical protein